MFYRRFDLSRDSIGAKKKESGEGGIRTHGGVTPTPVFETGLFNRSSTSPASGRNGYSSLSESDL